MWVLCQDFDECLGRMEFPKRRLPISSRSVSTLAIMTVRARYRWNPPKVWWRMSIVRTAMEYTDTRLSSFTTARYTLRTVQFLKDQPHTSHSAPSEFLHLNHIQPIHHHHRLHQISLEIHMPESTLSSASPPNESNKGKLGEKGKTYTPSNLLL